MCSTIDKRHVRTVALHALVVCAFAVLQHEKHCCRRVTFVGLTGRLCIVCVWHTCQTFAWLVSTGKHGPCSAQLAAWPEVLSELK